MTLVVSSGYAEVAQHTQKPFAFIGVGAERGLSGWPDNETSQAALVKASFVFGLTGASRRELVIWAFAYDQQTAARSTRRVSSTPAGLSSSLGRPG